MKNIYYLVLTILVIVGALILFKTCKGTPPKLPEIKTITKYDTTYLHSPVVKVIKYVPKVDTVYLDRTKEPKPSTELAELTLQYEMLADRHYSKVEYKDTVKLKDSLYKNQDLGTVYVNDVVSENQLVKRDISYELKYPVITNTTTITKTVEASKKNQFYVGGQVLGNKANFVNSANLLFLLKNKRDVMYGVSVGGLLINSTVQPQFGVTLMKKIKL